MAGVGPGIPGLLSSFLRVARAPLARVRSRWIAPCLGVLLVLVAGCARDVPRSLAEGPCRSDRDCVFGLVCAGAPGRCLLEDYGPCGASGECLPGRTCRQARCTVECVADRECADGKTCRFGECRLETTDTGCVLPGDCPSGLECVAGRCQAPMRSQCLRDLDCTPPQRCLGGRCR